MHALKKFYICIVIAKILATCNGITTTKIGATEALGKIRVSTDVDNELVRDMTTLETDHGMEAISNGEMERSPNTDDSTRQERSRSSDSVRSVEAVTMGMGSTGTSGAIAGNPHSGTMETKWRPTPESIGEKSSFHYDAQISTNEISTARTPVVRHSLELSKGTSDSPVDIDMYTTRGYPTQHPTHSQSTDSHVVAAQQGQLTNQTSSSSQFENVRETTISIQEFNSERAKLATDAYLTEASHITKPNHVSDISRIRNTDATPKPTPSIVDGESRNNMTMPVCVLSLRVNTNGLSFVHSRQNCTIPRSPIPGKVFMAPSHLLNITDTCVPGDEQVIGATHGQCSAQSASSEGFIDRWVCLRNETIGVIRICPIPSGAEVEGTLSEYVIKTCGSKQDSITYMELFVTAKIDDCLIQDRRKVQFKPKADALEYSVLAVATTGIALSVMLIIVFIGQLRSKLSSGNVYFLSLAMADLGHLLVVAIKFTMSLVEYRPPDIIVLFELSTRFYCMLMVLAVTIDRYIAVVSPLKTVLIKWQRTIKVRLFLHLFHAETTFVHISKCKRFRKLSVTCHFGYVVIFRLFCPNLY